MKLKNIYTYGGEPAQRFLTVADFIQLRGTRKFTSTVPNTFEEAQACAEAGIDHLSICFSHTFSSASCNLSNSSSRMLID